jgi:hypothetical protein
VIRVCVLLGSLLLSDSDSTVRRTTPLFTNEDLDRLHPHRGETGVLSVPAVAPSAPKATSRARSRRASEDEGGEAQQEAFWRREAARHQRGLARLVKTAARLRHELDQRRRERPPGKRGVSLASWEARLAEVESEIQQAEAEFADRARRAGALPGWLR